MIKDSSGSSLATGFHVSETARSRFALKEFSFTPSGAVSLEGFYAARLLANKANNAHVPMTPPARAGNVNALSTITGILRYVFDLYVKTNNPNVVSEAVSWLEDHLGSDSLQKTCDAFAEQFCPTSDVSADREMIVKEMLILWLENSNSAATDMMSFFDDRPVRDGTSYRRLLSSLRAFFKEQPLFGPQQRDLVNLLRSPAIAEPESLARQLEYIKREWGSLLGDHLLRVLSAIDLLKEEEKVRLPGPAPPQAMQLDSLEGEPENYSLDKDWMPNLVLMAKNVPVWLWQLSEKHGREIRRLDEIPDEELETLARHGITGIWLIGVWERSAVSKRIKELTGNVNATSSAYSIFEYQVAANLGGEDAMHALGEKAWRFGIRMGADMVPNHTGIYSKWVVEHPDWFVSTPFCPFPSYSFGGENLSRDDRVQIFLEDHYYDRSDAAVVFKLVSTVTGDVRYVYHGNDGTVMPWNDTAQLNYLNAEVRDAVVETILHVAKLFPVIRFDAAMTLTKMHYQRLWFPEPGTGGAVPSRAEQGLSKAQFTASMPAEFWREVVDRVAVDAPDTLLLAEAFWLTEGYFVRTLGMHRVYNSAFMNMLREEDNAGYRKLVKDTLAFDPEILKRYVNFMNNPDEETAVVQFGKGGKYFGICAMMATMPGLPMLGHGQIEGLAEKYGVEYPRPWWDERVDEHLVRQHEEEIVPLLKKRHLFSGVERFAFYDAYKPDGSADENVFVYSTRAGDEKALFVYHNKWGDTAVSVRMSVPFLQKRADGARELKTISLYEGLGLINAHNTFLLFRDHISGLEFIRNSREVAEQGLRIQLGAYSYHVFWDFKEVEDDRDLTYSRLSSLLGGAGVPSLEIARVDLQLQPIHNALAALLSPDAMGSVRDRSGFDQFESLAVSLFRTILEHKGLQDDPAPYAHSVRQELEYFIEAVGVPIRDDPTVPQEGPVLCPMYTETFPLPLLVSGIVFRATSRLLTASQTKLRADQWATDLRVEPPFYRSLETLGISAERIGEFLRVARLVDRFSDEILVLKVEAAHIRSLLVTMLNESEMNQFLEVNEHDGVIWFSKERLDTLLCWVGFTMSLNTTADDRAATMASWSELSVHISTVAETTRYQLPDFLETLRSPKSKTP